ncbi:hypothetical protein PRZ48_011896 [Zasmidium cellare]|uniref:F-box domain-containing protein n=1 Tax=Zasmidium cellare TaxID=395010 RepID=A0ABR0E7V2_ZASCE|nr:hypothetical protein PRZ48_011896 [Zasmidium cellare]
MSVLSKPRYLDKRVAIPLQRPKKKPKTSLLDLPQEVRDHIWSFIMPQYDTEFPFCHLTIRLVENDGPAWRLASTCRTISRDIFAMYWSKNAATVTTGYMADEEELRYVRQLNLIVLDCVTIEQRWNRPHFLVSKKDGGFSVELEFYDPPWMWTVGEVYNDTKERRDIVRQGMRAEAQPHLEHAERMLSENGCITLDALRVLATSIDGLVVS